MPGKIIVIEDWKKAIEVSDFFTAVINKNYMEDENTLRQARYAVELGKFCRVIIKLNDFKNIEEVKPFLEKIAELFKGTDLKMWCASNDISLKSILSIIKSEMEDFEKAKK